MACWFGWIFAKFGLFILNYINLFGLGGFLPGFNFVIGGSPGFTVYMKNEEIKISSPNTRQVILTSFYETKIKYKDGFSVLGSDELRYYLPKIPLTIAV